MPSFKNHGSASSKTLNAFTDFFFERIEKNSHNPRTTTATRISSLITSLRACPKRSPTSLADSSSCRFHQQFVKAPDATREQRTFSALPNGEPNPTLDVLFEL